MPNTINAQPTPAAIALHILEHGNWQHRGLAGEAIAAPPAVISEQAIYGAPGAKPRRLDGRFRSTRGDIAFAAA